MQPPLPCGGVTRCPAWPSALQGTHGPLRAIPRWALTGCWASWAGSSRQLCRRALGRTGCRGAGLGHRRAPAPSLGEGFSQEAGSGGSSFPFQGRVGQDGGGGGWEAGPTPLPGSVCSSLASCWVPSLWSLPEATPASPQVPRASSAAPAPSRRGGHVSPPPLWGLCCLSSSLHV